MSNSIWKSCRARKHPCLARAMDMESEEWTVERQTCDLVRAVTELPRRVQPRLKPICTAPHRTAPLPKLARETWRAPKCNRATSLK